MRLSPRARKVSLTVGAQFFIGLITYRALLGRGTTGFSVLVMMLSFGPVGCLGAAIRIIG